MFGKITLYTRKIFDMHQLCQSILARLNLYKVATTEQWKKSLLLHATNKAQDKGWEKQGQDK